MNLELNVDNVKYVNQFSDTVNEFLKYCTTLGVMIDDNKDFRSLG